jgi:hypothetical protein
MTTTGRGAQSWGAAGASKKEWWDVPQVAGLGAKGQSWQTEPDDWETKAEEEEEEEDGEDHSGRTIRNWKRAQRRNKMRTAHGLMEKEDPVADQAGEREGGGDTIPAAGTMVEDASAKPPAVLAATSQSMPGGGPDLSTRGGTQLADPVPPPVEEPVVKEDVPVVDQEEEEEEEEVDDPSLIFRRTLRPRTPAGTVAHPPKPTLNQVFPGGGGRN